MSIRGAFLVLVVIALLEGWTRPLQFESFWIDYLSLYNLLRIGTVVSVRSSNKASLFSNELVKMLVLLLFLLSSESRHSSIKGIHSP